MSSTYTLFTFNSKLRRHGLQLEHDKESGTLTVKASGSNTRKKLTIGIVCLALGLGTTITMLAVLFSSEATVIPNLIFFPFIMVAAYGGAIIYRTLSHASANRSPQQLRPDAFVHNNGDVETVVPKDRMNNVDFAVESNSEGSVKKITLQLKYDDHQKSLPIFSVGSSDREDLKYYLGYLNNFYGLE